MPRYHPHAMNICGLWSPAVGDESLIIKIFGILKTKAFNCRLIPTILLQNKDPLLVEVSIITNESEKGQRFKLANDPGATTPL